MPIPHNRPTTSRGSGPSRAAFPSSPGPRQGVSDAPAPARPREPSQSARSFRDATAWASPAAVPAVDLAAIVEATPDVVYRADRSGRLVYLNPSGRKALGLGPRDDLGHLTLAGLHGPEDRALLQARAIPRALRDGHWSGDLRLRGADGRDRPVSLVLQAHRDAAGDLQGFSAIFRDRADDSSRIAAAERARDRAEAEAQAKSDLLARMGHELRTPLTSILGFAEYLARSEESLARPEGPGAASPARADCLDLIRRSGAYLVELLDDLLDLATIGPGRMVPVLSACSPSAIAGDVVALLSRRAEEKGLRLEMAASVDLPALVEADPLRIRQILINLVGNAVKFTDRGSVRVEVGLSGESRPGAPVLRVDVVDTGRGLSPGEVARLGEPFYRADPGRPRDELGGTGLGLAISWQLAERLGGSIEVRSEPGRGSRFRLTLPTRAVAAPTAPGTGSAATPAPFDAIRPGCRILLAEDVPSSRLAIAACLEMAGAEVVAVGNGLEAVEAALSAERAGAPFDVALLDIQMPVLDGPGAIRSLRQQGYARPILALTAEAGRQDHPEYLGLGCDGCVGKPVDWAELIGLIRTAMESA